MERGVLLTFTLLATIDYQAGGKLTVKPRDTDINVNHSTYFNCSTDIGPTTIFWFHGNKHVFAGFAILEPYNERFEVNRNEWNGTYTYNLVIHSVQTSDAGEYICQEDEGVGEKFSVQLVVLEDGPICRSNGELLEVIGQNSCNIEPDGVELECSATFYGNIPPQMEWKRVGENRSTPAEVTVVTSRNYFVATLKLKGDIVLDNTTYVCEARRTTQGTNNCTQVIQILYALNDNSTANATIGDEIHCKANTSQTCNYKWKWLQDNDFTIESSTSVLMARKAGWHRCEAECHLRNRTCNLNLVMRAMIYGETGSNESSQTKTIIISVVVTVVVTVVTAFVVIIAWALISVWRDDRRDKAYNKNLDSAIAESELSHLSTHRTKEPLSESSAEMHDENNERRSYDNEPLAEVYLPSEIIPDEARPDEKFWMHRECKFDFKTKLTEAGGVFLNGGRIDMDGRASRCMVGPARLWCLQTQILSSWVTR